jgi:hypothetical protein
MTAGLREQRVVPRLIGAGLVLDAVWAGLGVASGLAGAAGHSALVLVMIALRALTGALEVTGAWLLANDRPAARPIVRSAAVAAAGWMTLGVGFRLAPSSLDPAFRLPVVGLYWVCALFVLAILNRR